MNDDARATTEVPTPPIVPEPPQPTTPLQSRATSGHDSGAVKRPLTPEERARLRTRVRIIVAAVSGVLLLAAFFLLLALS